MAGSPKEKEREYSTPLLQSLSDGFMGIPKGAFPFGPGVRGVETPEERGGLKSFRDLCGIFQARGKSQEQGAFPCSVPPSNNLLSLFP